MSTSYPRRDNTRGVWKLSNITSNIVNQGTWPGSFGDVMLFGGGSPGSDVNTIQKIAPSTLGNATDFGDLIQLKISLLVQALPQDAYGEVLKIQQ